jgi:hypothetical protein
MKKRQSTSGRTLWKHRTSERQFPRRCTTSTVRLTKALTSVWQNLLDHNSVIHILQKPLDKVPPLSSWYVQPHDRNTWSYSSSIETQGRWTSFHIENCANSTHPRQCDLQQGYTTFFSHNSILQLRELKDAEPVIGKNNLRHKNMPSLSLLDLSLASSGQHLRSFVGTHIHFNSDWQRMPSQLLPAGSSSGANSSSSSPLLPHQHPWCAGYQHGIPFS